MVGTIKNIKVRKHKGENMRKEVKNFILIFAFLASASLGVSYLAVSAIKNEVDKCGGLMRCIGKASREIKQEFDEGAKSAL